MRRGLLNDDDKRACNIRIVGGVRRVRLVSFFSVIAEKLMHSPQKSFHLPIVLFV